MKFTIDNGSLVLDLDKSIPLDYKYMMEYKPYKMGKHYKVPLTLTAFHQFLNHFKLNGFEYLNLIQQLNYLTNFNKTEFEKSNNPNLRAYQYQGVEWAKHRLLSSQACLLLWAMRSGKTRTTTHITMDYKKVVVMTLAGQEANWEQTYKEFDNKPIFNIHNKTPKKRQEIYEAFGKSESGVLIGSMNSLAQDTLSGVFKSNFDVLVIDEIHKVKNTKTKLNKGTKLLRSMCPNAIGLTGTPVSKHINEMLPLIALLWNHRYSKTYLANYFFNQEYSEWSGYGYTGGLKKEKETEWLEFIGMNCSQVTKEQALPWANKPSYQVLKLKYTSKQRKIYERCLTQFEIAKPDGETIQIQEVIAQFTYLRQISTSPKLLGFEESGVKENWLLEFLENYEGDGVIVFSTHTSYLKMLYETIKDKYKVCMITGETKDKVLVANDFQRGKYNIILANIQAGSKGITLDRADTMIFLDEDWKPDENQQAVERFTPVSKENQKLRQIIRLEANEEFVYGTEVIKTIDKYMNDVVTGKVKQTELINNFKEIFKNLG